MFGSCDLAFTGHFAQTSFVLQVEVLKVVETLPKKRR